MKSIWLFLLVDGNWWFYWEKRKLFFFLFGFLEVKLLIFVVIIILKKGSIGSFIPFFGWLFIFFKLFIMLFYFFHDVVTRIGELAIKISENFLLTFFILHILFFLNNLHFVVFLEFSLVFSPHILSVLQKLIQFWFF